MREIEAKYLAIHPDAMIARPLAGGAQAIFDGPVEAFFFEHPALNLRQQRKILRRVGTDVDLAVRRKVSSVGAKIMEETEVQVSDFTVARKMLEELGFREVRGNRKRRRSFRKGGLRYEIDEIPGHPATVGNRRAEYRGVGTGGPGVGIGSRSGQVLVLGGCGKSLSQVRQPGQVYHWLRLLAQSKMPYSTNRVPMP